MSRHPSRRAVHVVRAVKGVATSAVVGTAMVLTLSGAFASPEAPADVDRSGADARCGDAKGQAIVRTPNGATRAVPFKQGWRVYRGERPGSLVVVCPD